jgi:hypothetical protein
VCFVAFITRLQMASHNIVWVPGAHVRFRSLDFIVTSEGDLVRAPAPVPPSLTTNLDTVVEAFEELQLRAPRAHTSDYG